MPVKGEKVVTGDDYIWNIKAMEYRLRNVKKHGIKKKPPTALHKKKVTWLMIAEIIKEGGLDKPLKRYKSPTKEERLLGITKGSMVYD